MDLIWCVALSILKRKTKKENKPRVGLGLRKFMKDTKNRNQRATLFFFKGKICGTLVQNCVFKDKKNFNITINNKHKRYQLIDLHTKHKMISILKHQLAIEALIIHYHQIIQQEAYDKHYQQS
ncbi:hypothetical protein ACJX0J_007694 [Zea mays]